MGCIPSTRVSSSVPRAESVMVKETGSIPTTPVLTNPAGDVEGRDSASRTDGTGPDVQKEESQTVFQRTPTPRPQTSETQSPDSGVHELYDEYADVVTEFSAPEKVRAVELEFKPLVDIELVVQGKQCPRRMSGKDRERHEQEAILNKLRKEGLVLRPESKASGGVAFELVSAETEEKPSTKGATRKLPPLLQKKKRKNKEHSRVTKESILDKLEKAEDRRKKQVEEKVRKAKAFLEEACPSRKPVEEANITHVVKMASKIESRDKRLEDMVRKLKAKEEHAERVRRRKLLRQATIQDSTEAPI
ncbi:uncharacterized protein LOC119164927 isoform X1 [Rhipicephalus microplus]|uniref:uncharacterized protein LOC119164927 isoform X1 n=1 Tax=Rhipicephalus microplus TaxID=6941 RepID=UPI003F6C213B